MQVARFPLRYGCLIVELPDRIDPREVQFIASLFDLLIDELPPAEGNPGK
jgi:hypothetical protein